MIIGPPSLQAASTPALGLGISQPAHCWLAGQLARAWNPAFSPFHPIPEELIQAAALHDFGYLDWERHPAWNPQTGLPFTFGELPCQLHLRLFRQSFERALSISAYAALFVSLHTTRLGEHPSAHRPPDEQEGVESFLRQAKAEQGQLVESLRRNPRFAESLTPPAIEAQRKLVGAWDTLSLFLCGALGETATVELPPNASGVSSIAVSGGVDARAVIVAPWPFQERSLVLHLEARVFTRPFQDQLDLDEHFSALETIALEVQLRPA